MERNTEQNVLSVAGQIQKIAISLKQVTKMRLVQKTVQKNGNVLIVGRQKQHTTLKPTDILLLLLM